MAESDDDGVVRLPSWPCAATRPNWWRDPTMKIRDGGIGSGSVRCVAADLILPDGSRETVGSFPETTPVSEVRERAGEAYRRVWDASRNRRR